MKRVTIDLADRSYDILIGRNLLEQAGTLVADLLTPSRVVLLTHPTLKRLYGDRLAESFQQAGHTTHILEIPEGESSKSAGPAERVFDKLMEWQCDRSTLLVALGGGVIGDLTGFIAATYVAGRSVRSGSHIPSGSGGQQRGRQDRRQPSPGQEHDRAFYQPKMVLIDLDTLETLPEKEFLAGMAEIIKHGVIEDAALFEYLETHSGEIMEHATDSLERIISTSCEIKARVVEKTNGKPGTAWSSTLATPSAMPSSRSPAILT